MYSFSLKARATEVVIQLTLSLIGDAGYDVLILQRFAVIKELADILETADFEEGNHVFLELQDFYESCINSHFSDDFDIEPLRVLYKELGKISSNRYYYIVKGCTNGSADRFHMCGCVGTIL